MKALRLLIVAVVVMNTSIAADGDGLGDREAFVDGDDLSVREDDVRRGLLSGQYGDATCEREHQKHC